MNLADINGSTALTYAIGHKVNIEIIKALLRACANVNSRDKRLGKTVLMHAAMRSRDPEVIKILLRAGADITARDNINSTVKDYAELNPNSVVRNIFDKLDTQ